MIELEPPIPRAEEQEEYAKRERESVALWHWNDDWYENSLIRGQAWAEAKQEFLRSNPWARQWFS
jgi:hypothetical protein